MRGTLAELMRKYDGKIHFVYRHLPLTQSHPFAQAAAEASECAGEQGRFWPYHDLVFENAASLNARILQQLASRAKVRDLKRFRKCVQTGRYRGRVAEDSDVATALGISGTPAFFIGRPVGKGMLEGELLSGAQPLENFERMVELILAKRKG